LKKIKWLFLLLAIMATTCMIGFAIAVAERSVIGMLASTLLLVFVMGMGFMKKKKMRENGTL
jgi:Family of unknown function (DUF5325)